MHGTGMLAAVAAAIAASAAVVAAQPCLYPPPAANFQCVATQRGVIDVRARHARRGGALGAARRQASYMGTWYEIAKLQTGAWRRCCRPPARLP